MHRDRPVRTGGGFTYFKHDRPHFPMLDKHPGTWGSTIVTTYPRLASGGPVLHTVLPNDITTAIVHYRGSKEGGALFRNGDVAPSCRTGGGDADRRQVASVRIPRSDADDNHEDLKLPRGRIQLNALHDGRHILERETHLSRTTLSWTNKLFSLGLNVWKAKVDKKSIY